MKNTSFLLLLFHVKKSKHYFETLDAEDPRLQSFHRLAQRCGKILGFDPCTGNSSYRGPHAAMHAAAARLPLGSELEYRKNDAADSQSTASYEKL